MRPLKRILTLFALLSMLLSLAIASTVSASDVEQTFEQPILVVNTSFLNVRTGPGVQYTVLATVVGGTELPVLGLNPDGVWYQVATNNGPGWVNVTFTLPRGDFSNVPLVEVGESGAPNVNLGQGGGASAPVATSANVRFTGVNLLSTDLREQPNANSLILTTSVPLDDSVVYPLLNAVTGDDGVTWYQVSVPGIATGWTDRVAFRLLDCSEADVVGVTNTFQVPISFDGISDQSSYTLTIGTEGFIGAFTDATATRVYFELVDGTIGIVPREALTPREGVTNVCDGIPSASNSALGQGGGATAATATDGTAVTVPQTVGSSVVIINTPFLNVRSGPGAGFASVATVSGGTELVVLGRASDDVWLLVQGDFGQGWVNNQFTIFRGVYSSVPLADDMVTMATTTTETTQDTAVVVTDVTTSQVTGNRVVINTGNLNVRSGPGAGFSVVATVPGATELAVVGRATDGVWIFVEGTFGQGWVNSQFVLFRGNYGTVPVIDLSGN